MMMRADKSTKAAPANGAMKLDAVRVEKPWGRDRLPVPFADITGARIGEIWFPAPAGTPSPLLVKYLFTGEPLSVQVHPDDAQARARGLLSGKEECWYIVDADPGAMLGIGTKRALTPEELRAAALSGDIEELMQWYPAQAGQIYHIPPGTIHAIGAGVSLIEVQQNSDITYRLYDYGRPRALHLDDAVAVAKAEPFPDANMQSVSPDHSRILLKAGHFTLAHIAGDDCSILDMARGKMAVVPVAGRVIVECASGGSVPLAPGDCAMVAAGTVMHSDAAHTRYLAAWPG